jgi:hypothetical protein
MGELLAATEGEARKALGDVGGVRGFVNDIRRLRYVMSSRQFPVPIPS